MWVISLEKYYTNDFGLRFALLGFSDKALSGLLENVVYLEWLNRGYQVSIGKQGDYEIDFIAVKGHEKWYLRVAYRIEKPHVFVKCGKVLSKFNRRGKRFMIIIRLYF